MNETKKSGEENPLIYYAIILIALGLVAYKWLDSLDKTILINLVIQIGLILISTILFLAISAYAVKGYILKEENAKVTTKLLIHITNILVVAIFIYRTIEKETTTYFYIPHLIITVLIVIYYNYALHNFMFEKKEARKRKKEQIAKEKREIENFIDTDLDNLTLEQLEKRLEYFRYKIYLNESANAFHGNYYRKFEELKEEIARKTKESELLKIQIDKENALRELKNIRWEKQKLAMSEESKKAQQKYMLTHAEENVILSEKLTQEEKEILTKTKFKQVNEYCVKEKKILSVFVKPIMNHSATHTFLVWSTKKILQDFNVTNIVIHDTKDADIVFKHDNKYYAIEIETGNLLQKKKQLEQKIYWLNKKYSHRWFFIVSNRNLQAKYKPYGICTQRNRVYKILQEMLEDTHPRKAGVKEKTTTKNVQK